MKSLIKTLSRKLEVKWKKKKASNNYRGMEYTTKSTTQLKIMLSSRISQKRDVINFTLYTEFILKILRRKTEKDLYENILNIFGTERSN